MHQPSRVAAALLAALVALLAFAPSASAWSVRGHRLVGGLAERELAPRARAEVDRLLAGEAEPTLAGVSAWADEVRANDPVLGRRSAPWHYVTMRAPDCAYDAARDCPGGDCVVEAIRAQVAILADRGRSLADRRQALKFVVHFVGDVHQPLHANNRGDKGGNEVQVRIPQHGGGERGGNLHGLWDRGLVDYTGLSEPDYLARLERLPLAIEQGGPAVPPAAHAWAEHACAIAMRPGLYPATANVPAGYMAAWTPIADEQLRRAGSRLAQLLNAALAP
ncbi:S1/P1 nuclease [Lysobacter humi (ex Lee et al. 2017)]